MNKLLIFLLLFLSTNCTNTKKVYWCGDHACINNKEKKAYFKKTMIVEIREINKKDKKQNSMSEEITEQAILEEKKRIKKEKNLVKLARLEEKRRIKEEKELAKQVRLDEKRRISEEKELSKKNKKNKKKLVKIQNEVIQNKKIKNSKNNAVINDDSLEVDISSYEFKTLVDNINKKNMFRSYPDINDIPK